MAIPHHPSSISVGTIRDEFGGSTSTRLGAYYAGGGIVPLNTRGYPKGVETLIPRFGMMSIGNFHGAINEYLLVFRNDVDWVVPSRIVTGTLLLVGGGGGGGQAMGVEAGGGGGAGGVIYETISLTPGSVIPIRIGAGGYTNNGGNSQFGSYVAIGGGCGGIGPNGVNGNNGGSGGGGMGVAGPAMGGAPTIAGQGNSGGIGFYRGVSGGGGGIAQAGGTHQAGNGRAYTLFGVTFEVGGGGGDGICFTFPWYSPGGYGGGGGSGQPGIDGTGGGGGGGQAVGGFFPGHHGQRGGSGICAIHVRTG